jgi:hypothetical protein
MCNRLSTIFINCLIALTLLSPASAQQTPQPAPPPSWWYSWGEGYGWSFWWICPLMMLFMMLMCGGMFFRHMSSRDRSER